MIPKKVGGLRFQVANFKLQTERSLELSAARTGKERLQVLTEFFRGNYTHDFTVEFFEVINITDIPWRDDHPGAKPSIHP